MTIWNLQQHGDGPERRFYKWLRADFPTYEEFWRRHVIPLTYRIIKEELVLVRVDLPEELQDFATAHYNVFFRLALAAREREDKEIFKKPIGYQLFYLHLHTAINEMVQNFLSCSSLVLERYAGVRIRDLAVWETKWAVPTLVSERNQLIEEMSPYRQYAAHLPVLATLDGLIPNPDFLVSIASKRGEGALRNEFVRLSQKARLLGSPELCREKYSDIEIITSGHFERSLKLCDRIWKGMLGEFDQLESHSRYLKDQEPTARDKEYARQYLSKSESITTQGPQGLWSGPTGATSH